MLWLWLSWLCLVFVSLRSFDVEAVAVFALVLVCFLFVRAVNTGSIFCSALAATAYFYLVAAWGGVSLAFG